MRFVRIKLDGDSRLMTLKNKCMASVNEKIDKCKNADIKAKFEELKNNTAGKAVSFKENILNNFAEKAKKSAVSLWERTDKKILAYAGTAAGAVLCVAVLVSNFSFAYNAFLGDTELGYVPGKEYVNLCVENINSEFAPYVSGEKIIRGDVVYVPSMVRKGAFTSKEDVEENIKSTSDVMTKAYAVEIDGRAFAAVDNRKDAENILDAISSEYRTDENTEIEFKEDVEITHQYVPMIAVMSAEQAEAMLTGYKTVYSQVQLKGGMLLSDLASVYGADIEDIKDANPGISRFVDGAEEIKIPRVEPVISVVAYDTVSYETKLPYDEKVSRDGSMYQGAEKIIQKGSDGVSEVTEKVERINGEVTDKVVVSSVVKSTPVTQMRAVGTKERPAHMGTGTFLRPYGGTISSRYGSRRSGHHTGVDFCGTVGDPIIAADSGTVIFSGWSGGYGKIVKIDHNNGYVTYYAHCNDLYVNEGDVVQKGDTIAALGNTGNSTGPHVHFEVHHNNSEENPMDYVD